MKNSEYHGRQTEEFANRGDYSQKAKKKRLFTEKAGYCALFFHPGNENIRHYREIFPQALHYFARLLLSLQ
ncbi:MAG: hypothetical protein IIV89_04675 [Bacteroidaceae bacterium]|nr:hypothetical protein [Bacteroidaceae bacterium]